MKIKSNDFEPSGLIPPLFTCDGQDISPHLAWEEVPEGTKSLALIVDDPDAPAGTWVHWLICNIPANVREVPQGRIPAGAHQVRNDFGKANYGGPCPPGGTHRYFFKLYALNVGSLEGVDERNFYEKVEEHKIAEAVLMGKYSRR
ncbi:MAG: YbhB/YbcL family Raf kinase inhibitor-like protein [Thermoplasmata archaeon]|nr:MAG: YbhB/YbcL family Raf kinase inhibitor-like protein [Thermoplasmata archaeon]